MLLQPKMSESDVAEVVGLFFSVLLGWFVGALLSSNSILYSCVLAICMGAYYMQSMEDSKAAY